jgi:cobalt-precorrin 5A hydrolase
MCSAASKEKKIVIFSFTEKGSRLNQDINFKLSSSGYECESYTVWRYADQFRIKPLKKDLKNWIGENWRKYTFLFIGAVGIAVRYIAPWVDDKYKDPAVVCIDECGQYVIPVLSGHVGGGVYLASIIAKHTGAVPVITTATDIQNKFAVDVFAKANHLTIGSRVLAKQISAAVLQNDSVGFYSDFPIEGEIPEELTVCSSFEELFDVPIGIAILDKTVKRADEAGNILYLFPQNLVIGVGCKRGTPRDNLQNKLEQLLRSLNKLPDQIEAIASIDLKQDETGILEMAQEYDVPFVTYSADSLQEVDTVSSKSEFVAQITGVDNVCERAAIKHGPSGELIQKKIKMDGVTFAVVRNRVNIKFEPIRTEIGREENGM